MDGKSKVKTNRDGQHTAANLLPVSFYYHGLSFICDLLLYVNIRAAENTTIDTLLNLYIV